IHGQIPARVRGYEVSEAIGRGPVVQKGNRESRRIDTNYRARGVHCARNPLGRARGERNWGDSARIRPDERQTGALIEHARSNDVASVAHAESERSIEPRQRANLEGHVAPDIVNDPDVTSSVIRINALSYDPA